MKNKKVAAAYKKRFGKEPGQPDDPKIDHDYEALFTQETEPKPKSERALIYTLALSVAILAKEVMDKWP